jgi:hypothetical protein
VDCQIRRRLVRLKRSVACPSPRLPTPQIASSALAYILRDQQAVVESRPE